MWPWDGAATGKTIALTRLTLVGKVMSLLSHRAHQREQEPLLAGWVESGLTEQADFLVSNQDGKSNLRLHMDG